MGNIDVGGKDAESSAYVIEYAIHGIESILKCISITEIVGNSKSDE